MADRVPFPCDVTDILNAIEGQIVTDLALPAKDVFSTIADDQDVPGLIPSPFFVSLHAGVLRQRGSAGRPPWAVSPFTLEDPITTSAGRTWCSANGSVQIKLWIQFKEDNSRFEGDWMKNATTGAFRRLRMLLKSLHMFDPSAVPYGGAANSVLLQEPMRCHGWASFPFRWSEVGKGTTPSWGRLETDWDFTYLQSLA